MGYTAFAIAVALALFLHSSVALDDRVNSQGNRKPSVLPDDIYEALINLAEGKALPPVKEWTTAMRTAAVRFWRAKGRILVKEEKGKKELYFDGRQMLRSSEVNEIVEREFDRTKGSGAAKLACGLRDNFVGLSHDKIQNILNTDKSHYRRNAKFMNKATLKPVRARDVHMRHQIDLMDMGSKGSVKLNGKLYRCVLTVIDVFSRFVWLRPLTNKSSKDVAKELKSIYMEHGAPRIVQNDQGGEFKKAVKKLCERMDIKLIYSRPRHPQSQGKVERCHRSLRSKIEYDLSKMGQDGVNWAKQIPLYQRILNNDPKEVIAHKTPFEIYFARKCNNLRESGLEEECLPSPGKIRPTENDRKLRSRQASKVRKQAQKATKRCDKRAQRTQLRLNPPSVYSVGETVYLRLRGRSFNKRHITEARVEERNIQLHTYKVSYTSPLTGKKEKKWVPVDDVTSLTLQREKQKQKVAKLSKRKKNQHYKKYHIAMRKDDYVGAIEDQGYKIAYNPPGDGNCQFSALSHQLQKLGIFSSAETMREEIVDYLESNPYDNEGFPLLEHLADNEFASWSNYTNHMSQDGAYGDQLTLYAAANLYNIDVQIVFSLGAGGQHVFSPSASIATATVYLGHFAENPWNQL